MSEWITDRLPTEEDADDFFYVWITHTNGDVRVCNWRFVKPQMPWQPTNKPSPYVKPKRWSFKLNSSNRWELIDRQFSSHILLPLDCTGDIAHYLCKVHNEVMP